MKLYRVTLRTRGDENNGYEFLANKAVAIRKQNAENKESGILDEVDELDIKPTKKDIISFLNSWASYPDNG